ncbi:MAG: bifunctional shikimate kinase/3-dehydroquinate synthase [Solirubrobacterales bacterium]
MSAALDRKPALVFIGFMGAGKSKAARAARGAGLESLDADLELERALDMPIPDFFAARGEDEFRARERELVVKLLDRADGGALALGGGSVLADEVRESLERHVVVWLDVGVDEAWERVEGSSRPLARDRARFEELHAERSPIYESLADAIVPGRRDTVGRALPALRTLVDLPRGTRLAWATSASADYPAFVGRGLLGAYWPLDGEPVCVTDEHVGPIYGHLLAGEERRIVIPAGEPSKTWSEAERVLVALADLGVTRSDHIAALGGGVVGDLGGFCAATYQRGIDVVQVPTTLVAQVDSAYGGKTGVDLPQAKNYAGAYHQPAAVLTDPSTLETLPAPELAAGWPEVIKTALIAGGALWERVRAIESIEPSELDDVIFACARHKTGVVAADERDAGARQTLNLGHTVGHAIEAATAYRRYRHGEAVALGLLAALRLSGADAVREEVRDRLSRVGLPVTLDAGIDLDAVMAAMERDKKRTAEGVGFVLLARPGEPETGRRVDPGDVRAAVEELVSG